MPPNENAFVREAKMDHMMAIVADANDVKANSSGVREVREAERDALEELRGQFDSADEVYEVDLPSERL